jgi:HAD superfamily hydrolase (TIGR01509 family)
MIKLAIFDLDGVLASLKEAHYLSLNQALEIIDSKYIITQEEHTSTFDGLSTKKKLEMLVSRKNFPSNKINEVFENKQKFTKDAINKLLSHDAKLISTLSSLKNDGIKLYVASNAIYDTVVSSLERLGILSLFDRIFSNENVSHQKPSPEIYLKCMVVAGVSPQETIIIEDSRHGREAASKSGAYVCGVDSPEDVTYSRISKCINSANSKTNLVKWEGQDVTVLIPMAGAGSRFKQQGYKLPKPLIDVNGKPMIQWVVENLNMKANFVFVVQKSHYEEYNLGIILPLIAPGCKIVQTEGLTEGAACTTLLAKEYINNSDHLLIANSDQFVEWDSCDFMYHMISHDADGGILSFIDSTLNPKWSFAKLNSDGNVVEVAEKKPISDIATVGIYYFKRGNEYVKFTEQMISKNIRVNNEFYICPVYNEYVSDNKKIKTKNCNKMWGLGTPEDLQYFLSHEHI